MLVLKLEIDSKININNNSFKTNLEKRLNEFLCNLRLQNLNQTKRFKRNYLIKNKTKAENSSKLDSNKLNIDLKIDKIEIESPINQNKKHIKIYFYIENGAKYLNYIENNINNSAGMDKLSQKLRFKVIFLYKRPVVDFIDLQLKSFATMNIFNCIHNLK